MSKLKSRLAEKIHQFRSEIADVLKEHGTKSLGDCTVAQAYGGMRSLKCMVTETSAVDPDEGTRYRGYTIPDLQKKLPKAPGGSEPLPEGVFWLLLTGEIPTDEEVEDVRASWRCPRRPTWWDPRCPCARGGTRRRSPGSDSTRRARSPTSPSAARSPGSPSSSP